MSFPTIESNLQYCVKCEDAVPRIDIVDGLCTDCRLQAAQDRVAELEAEALEWEDVVMQIQMVEAQNAQLTADCAAYREALERIASVSTTREQRSFGEVIMIATLESVKRYAEEVLMSHPTAGREMAEEVARLRNIEALVREWRRLYVEKRPGDAEPYRQAKAIQVKLGDLLGEV